MLMYTNIGLIIKKKKTIIISRIHSIEYLKRLKCFHYLRINHDWVYTNSLNKKWYFNKKIIKNLLSITNSYLRIKIIKIKRVYMWSFYRTKIKNIIKWACKVNNFKITYKAYDKHYFKNISDLENKMFKIKSIIIKEEEEIVNIYWNKTDLLLLYDIIEDWVISDTLKYNWRPYRPLMDEGTEYSLSEIENNFNLYINNNKYEDNTRCLLSMEFYLIEKMYFSKKIHLIKNYIE